MENSNNKVVFDKANYLIMIVGLVIIAVGLFTMTMDKEDYGFGALGLTVGPVLLMIGFIVEFVAIFYKKK